MKKILALIGLAIAMSLAAQAAQAPQGLSVSAEGVLLKEGKPYRGIGVNYFSAFLRRIANPADTSYREGFAELEKRGIPFVRFAACGFWPADMKGYREDKEGYWRLMDDVVRAAEEHHIGLIPSLFWYTASVPDIVGEPRSQWANAESKTRAFMRQYIEEVVTRYRNSPAVWAWEFGNEFNLDVDLPNAADHRPPILPDLGTATARSEADDLTHDMLVSALTDFAQTVRKFDPDRAITSGNSLPRSCQQHLRAERAWKADSREEFAANLAAVNPAPINMASVHVYPGDHDTRFGQERTSYDEILTIAVEACRKAGQALFVGEFGAADSEAARRENGEILAAIERTGVPLAALWVFDLPSQESSINVSPTNRRAYLLEAVGEAHKRVQAAPEAPPQP